MPNEERPDIHLVDWLKLVIPNNISEIQDIIDTKPYRITKAYKELLAGYTILSAEEIITVTEEIEKDSYSGLVSGLSIDYLSFCAHHFLPFFGKVDVIYDPSDVIIGIGKLSRLVDYRAKRFNIQENIAKELCEDLMEFANARGAFARVSAKHTCLCYRGPTKYQSENVVVYSIGTCSDVDRQQNIGFILSST